MSFQHRELIAHLNNGAILAYPTETLWGLGCLANNQRALQRVADIKQRSIRKGFILISSDIKYCLPYINPSFHSLAKQKVKQNEKKPTTWLIPKSKNTSSLITGQFNTVAIRISPHPFIHQITHALRMPIISTSANIHLRPSLNSALLIQRFLGLKIDHIVHGYENGSGHASMIIDLQSNQIIRQ